MQSCCVCVYVASCTSIGSVALVIRGSISFLAVIIVIALLLFSMKVNVYIRVHIVSNITYNYQWFHMYNIGIELQSVKHD